MAAFKASEVYTEFTFPEELTGYFIIISIVHIRYIYQVATALLVAGSTLTFWILWQTPFASTSSSHASFRG